MKFRPSGTHQPGNLLSKDFPENFLPDMGAFQNQKSSDMHILCKSSNGKVRNRGFHTCVWRSSSQPIHDPGKTFWRIESRLKKFKLIQFLKVKALFGEPNLIELRCLYDAPGTLTDKLFVDALRAKTIKVSLETMSERLAYITNILEIPRLDQKLFWQWEKECSYNILEIAQPIRKPKKYSGYVKSPSSVGGKNRKLVQPDPGLFEWSSIETIDFYHALTVGELYLGKSLVIRLPDDGPNKVRNGHKNSLHV